MGGYMQGRQAYDERAERERLRKIEEENRKERARQRKAAGDAAKEAREYKAAVLKMQQIESTARIDKMNRPPARVTERPPTAAQLSPPAPPAPAPLSRTDKEQVRSDAIRTVHDLFRSTKGDRGAYGALVEKTKPLRQRIIYLSQNLGFVDDPSYHIPPFDPGPAPKAAATGGGGAKPSAAKVTSTKKTAEKWRSTIDLDDYRALKKAGFSEEGISADSGTAIKKLQWYKRKGAYSESQGYSAYGGKQAKADRDKFNSGSGKPAKPKTESQKFVDLVRTKGR